MKRFAYATAAIVLTGVLVVLAMAVAQRDARIGDASAIENELPYANQPAHPISSASDDKLGRRVSPAEEWPPAPIVRGNDSPPPRTRVGGPESRFPGSEILASYNEVGEEPNNIRSPSNVGRLAEPPPLSAISGTHAFNSFLAPTPGSANSSSRNNSSANSPIAPPVPSTLPSIPNSLSDLPLNQFTPSPLPITSVAPAKEPGFPSQPSAQIASPATLEATSPGSSNFPRDNSSIANSFPSADLAAPPTLPSGNSLSGPSAPASRFRENQSDEVPSQLPPTATLGSPMAPNLPKYEPQPKYEASPSVPAPRTFSDSPPSVTSQSSVTSQPAPSLPFNNASQETPQATGNHFNNNGAIGNSQSSQRQVGFSSAAPGGRQLDGAQNPSLEIRKRAPSEVQVGIPATFSVLVRNIGNATAFNVVVNDAVPKGAKLIRTSPQAQLNGTGLSWNLGEMQAGAEQTITIELEPISEGEIGSVASVNFAAQASVRTMSTQPKLLVKQLLEAVVLGGDSFKIMIDVTNAGTGTARNVRLEEDVPPNMRHMSGAKVLELSVGDLAPGESQKFDIELTAVSAGKVSNILRAVGENAAANESSATIEVISPKLQVGLEGPKLRYLERQATYSASITNTGTAIANEVYMTVFLPMGLHFNAAENEGVYIPDQHAVKWLLTELAAGKTAATKLTLLPVEEGEFVLRMQANADSVRADSIEKPVRVEGQSELAFSIEDDNDPIETEGKTTYIVKIVNTGTRVDNDVQLSLDLPDGASVEQVDAPVNYQVSSRVIQFAPIPQMKSKDQQTIRVVIRHSREGTHVLRAQLKSKLRPGAVIKEESTQVYRDQ